MPVLIRAAHHGPNDTLSLSVRAALYNAGAIDVVTFHLGATAVHLAHGVELEQCRHVAAMNPSVVMTDVSGGAPLAEWSISDAATSVSVGYVDIGGPEFVVMAGPCAVESAEQLAETAMVVKERGASILRGGAYKPRTSPYSFQGMGREGLELLAQVGLKSGMPVVSEVVDPRDVEFFDGSVDMLQVGARNAQNFSLLTEVGRSAKPVLLKRGFGCTVDEWLHAAEYILSEGNPGVVLCERGIRTFESSTRFTLDLAAVPVVKRRSHLPVVVDPSHGCGDRNLVLPLALAAAAVGADGLIVDVHPNASAARCDGDQALSPAEFRSLMLSLGPVASAVGRHVSEPVVAGMA